MHNVDTPTLTAEDAVEMLKAAGHRHIAIRKVVTTSGTITTGLEVETVGIILDKTLESVKAVFAGQPVKVYAIARMESVFVDFI